MTRNNTFVAVFALLTLMTGLTASAAEELSKLTVEDLGEPVRTMRLTGGEGEFLIPKPNDAGWWLLLSYHPVGEVHCPIRCMSST